MSQPIEYHVREEINSEMVEHRDTRQRESMMDSLRQTAAHKFGEAVFADCAKEEVNANLYNRTHTFTWSLWALPKDLSPKRMDFSFQENPETAVKRKLMEAVEEAQHTLDTQKIAGVEFVQTKLVLDMVEELLKANVYGQ